MKFIDFAFRLGVVFAVFGFLWGIIRLFIGILRFKTGEKSLVEEYSIKAVQYFFLADVTFLFCLNQNNSSEVLPFELSLGASILTLYFVGKLQNRQKRSVMMQGFGSALKQLQPMFNLKAEIGVITFSLGMFIFYAFNPTYAQNPISNWFYENILGIEKAPFFGYIFKIIGFFVLLGILNKIVNGFFFLISGKPLVTSSTSFGAKKEEDPNKFDDFEEL